MNKSPQPPIRWGISRTGRIARKFVAGLRLLDDAVVVAVGSRTQATADDFAETHRISRAHGSLEALAADPDVDVVYVSSTANAHCEQTIAYLEGFEESEFEGAASRQITLGFMPGHYVLGDDYLVQFAQPNFFFHVATAYGLLRHNGVPLGKRDFIGFMNFKPLPDA